MSAHGKDPRSPAASVAGGTSRYAKEVEGKDNNHLKLNLPEMYLRVKDPKDGVANRVMWAMSFLKGAAAVWKEGIVADYLENGESERKIVTNRVFESWNYFKIEMRKALGDPIREKTAARKIRRLKQHTSAVRYAAEFKKVAVDLE
jgi:hypothetical protein